MRSSFAHIAGKLGVALVLAVTTAGVAAGSAAATLPEYVLSSPAKIFPSGGAMTLETVAPEELFTRSVTCSGTSGEMEGEGLHLKEWTGTLQFWGCTEVGMGGTCTTPGAASGHIKTSIQGWRLFYLSKATHEVGVVFNYKSSGEVATFETFTCVVTGIAQQFAVRGTALAKITPVNKKTNKFTVSLTGSKGIPTLKEYETEGGAKAATKLEVQRNAGAWEAADLNSASLSFSVAGEVAEIKA
jgi:hypothetical protein